MILKTDFETFLKDIRPTSAMRDDLKKGHKTLRDRLNADADLKPILVSDFLQGSYRRYTAVRPKGEKRSDVDIIVVTKLDETEYTPKKALALFEPFLEKHYKGKWRPQGRSFGIELSYVELDVVPTSAPTEQEYGILQSDSVTHELGERARYFYSPKASKAEREAGLEGRDTKRANTHPTVKPIELMRYLVRMVTPPDGTVLDPFAGSGSTLCAAALEGFEHIGVEREEEYVTIARARVAHWTAEREREAMEREPTLFD